MYSVNINGKEIGIGFGKDERENPNYDAELEVLNKWVNLFNDRYTTNEFKIEQKTSGYTTLVLRDYDFLRLKYSPRVKWIKLPMFNDMIKKYIDDDRFATQNKKTEMYWKTIIEDEKDISNYFDILDDAFDNITRQ